MSKIESDTIIVSKPQTSEKQDEDSPVGENCSSGQPKEVLELQLSVAVPIGISCVALGNTDAKDFADQVYWTFAKVHNLFQHGARMASRYAGDANRISEITLHDVEVAMKENAPELAAALFHNIHPIIADLRRDGTDMQYQYQELQASILKLLYTGQQIKAGLDQHMDATAASPFIGQSLAHAQKALATELPEPCSEPLEHLQSDHHGTILISQPCQIKGWGYAVTSVSATREHQMALSGVLNELRQIGLDLEKWSTFWGCVDDMVQKLSHMKDHTETLVNFASRSQRLCELFEERLDGYRQCWRTLEDKCQQYCSGQKVASSKVHQCLHKVNATLDCGHLCANPEFELPNLKTGTEASEAAQLGKSPCQVSAAISCC